MDLEPSVSYRNIEVISYCIISMNRTSDLLKCLSDLSQQDYQGNVELALVLQAYSPEDEGLIRKYASNAFTNCKISSSSKGLGVYGARNRAIELASGEFLAFLDDDCRVKSNWIRELSELFTTEDIGGVGGYVNHPERTYGVARRLIYFLFGYSPTRYRIDWGGFHSAPVISFPGRTQTADWLSGGNMMLRRQAVDKVGFFDAIYGNYGFDDCDYGVRLRAAGYQLMTSPRATADHYPAKANRPAPHLHIAAEEERRVIFARRALRGSPAWAIKFVLRFAIHLTFIITISIPRLRLRLPAYALIGMSRGLRRGAMSATVA